MVVRLSTRISIRWLPEPAQESTDTVVLSVDDYFIDLRVCLADMSIDWAIGGTREILSRNPLHIRFNHSIDSRLANAPPDTGAFEKLPNGDDLETGEMANPEQGGAVMPYEEVWREIGPPQGPDLIASGTSNSWILQSTDRMSFIGKTGGLFIALRKCPHTFAARREEWVVGESRWVTKYVIGEDVAGTLPSLNSEQLKANEAWEAGISVTAFGERWDVRAVG